MRFGEKVSWGRKFHGSKIWKFGKNPCDYPERFTNNSAGRVIMGSAIKSRERRSQCRRILLKGMNVNPTKEFIQFLFIARGSSGELRTQLYLAIELKFIDNDKGRQLVEQSRKLSAMLSKLIKTRREYF